MNEMDSGKLLKLDHLEEVKVVTRFPEVDLREDHYRLALYWPFSVHSSGPVEQDSAGWGFSKFSSGREW